MFEENIFVGRLVTNVCFYWFSNTPLTFWTCCPTKRTSKGFLFYWCYKNFTRLSFHFIKSSRGTFFTTITLLGNKNNFRVLLGKLTPQKMASLEFQGLLYVKLLDFGHLSNLLKYRCGSILRSKTTPKTIGIKNSTHELPFFPMLANFSKVHEGKAKTSSLWWSWMVLPSFVFYTV